MRCNYWENQVCEKQRRHLKHTKAWTFHFPFCHLLFIQFSFTKRQFCVITGKIVSFSCSLMTFLSPSDPHLDWFTNGGMFNTCSSSVCKELQVILHFEPNFRNVSFSACSRSKFDYFHMFAAFLVVKRWIFHNNNQTHNNNNNTHRDTSTNTPGLIFG